MGDLTQICLIISNFYLLLHTFVHTESSRLGFSPIFTFHFIFSLSLYLSLSSGHFLTWICCFVGVSTPLTFLEVFVFIQLISGLEIVK